MIELIVEGNPEKPLLVCVPGMLGMPENFMHIAQGWQNDFCSIYLDLHPQNRDSGLADSLRSMASVSYDGTAQEICDGLVKVFPGRKFYFLGVSLGGKIILDFAAAFPELYAGGVLTDVGPGSLEDSELYGFSVRTVPEIDLNRDWSAIKAELRARIPVNTIRVFLQTQIDYSLEERRGRWKPAVRGIREFLGKQRIKDQWDIVDSIPERSTIILKASHLSGISDADNLRLRRQPQFMVEDVAEAAHFLHVTHRDRVCASVRSLLRINEAQPLPPHDPSRFPREHSS